MSHESTRNRKRRSALIAVIGICILALALRLAAIAAIGPDPNITGYSESGIIAKNLVDGRGFTYDFYGLRPDQPLQSFIPPLFVVLVYAILRWTVSPVTNLAVVQAILSSLVCGAIYIVALELSRKRSVALVAALAAVCYPVLIIMVNVPHSLITHTVVLTWALAITVLLPRRSGWGWAAAGGILWGLLVLGRPALLGFMPFVVLWVWLNRNSRYGWLKSSVVIALALILVILPWTIRNYRIHGQFVSIATNGGFNFWNGNNPFTTGSGHDVYTEQVDRFLGQPHDPQQPVIVQMQPYPIPADIQANVATVSEVALDRQLYQAGLDFIRDQPRAWVALMGRKLVSFWWFRPHLGASYEASWTPYYKLMYAMLMILFVVGLALSLKHWRRYSLLYMLFVYYTITNVTFHVLTRFRWEIEPLFLIFAALCLVTAVEDLWPGRRLGQFPEPRVTS
jgi:hypothetical protein